MRIALVHSKFARGGGMEAYLLALVKGFLQQGDQVTVFAPEIDETLVREVGCRVCRIGPSWPRKIREYLFLHNCRTLTNGKGFDLSISLAKTSGQQIAVCGGVHLETIQQTQRTALLRGVYDLFEKHYEKRMMQSTPTIMAHSKAVARDILKHYPVAAGKIQVLYPPIDTDQFWLGDSNESEKIRYCLGIARNKLVFLFVSCGHRRKGLQELLAAFSELDPDRYILLIAGSNVRKGLPRHIHYLGYINNLASLYSAADFTILPSQYEPFGLVVPESLQCGTPVILTRNVGAAELLTEREAFFLQDGSRDSIIELLSKIDGAFRVPPGFAQRHGLTIDAHIRDIKKLGSQQAGDFSDEFDRHD